MVTKSAQRVEVSLSHPMFGEVINFQLPAVRGRRIRRTLVRLRRLLNADRSALAALLTIGTAVSNPPRRGLLPLLVHEPSELTAGGVVIGVVQATAQTAGPLLAALLFGVSGPSAVLVAAAVCFAVAAVAEGRLPDTTHVAVRLDPIGSTRIVEEALRVLAKGFHAVRLDRELRLVAEIPRSAGGKPLRRVLRDQHTDRANR